MNNIRRLSILVAVALLLSAFVLPLAAESTRQSNFNPTGAFHVAKPQKEEIDSNFLAAIELERKRGRKGAFTGSLSLIRPNNTYDNFNFAVTIAGPEKFAFTTNAKQGVRYRFNGKFLLGGNYIEDFNRDSSRFDVPVMEGTLTKFKNGRKVAEEFFRFTYTAGG